MMSKLAGLAASLLFSASIASAQSSVSSAPADPRSYEKEIHADYLKSGQKEYMLVFYGYVGCTKICSPVLENLNRFYSSKEFAPYASNVDLVFVNLMSEVTTEQPDQFAKSFNQEFRGVYLSEKELNRIDKELQLFFTKRKGESFEIDHSDYVYLIRHEGKEKLRLINIYHTHPFIPSVVIDDLKAYITPKAK